MTNVYSLTFFFFEQAHCRRRVGGSWVPRAWAGRFVTFSRGSGITRNPSISKGGMETGVSGVPGGKTSSRFYLLTFGVLLEGAKEAQQLVVLVVCPLLP